MRPEGFRPDWERLLERWDAIHLAVDPLRLQRFDHMMDILEAAMPCSFVAVDLGSGPGPLAKRILERFSKARVVLVDHDTSLLKVGEEALREFGSRVQVRKLDLRSKGWERGLPFRKVDAVVTSLAIHDIPASKVPPLYQTLYGILRRHGVMLNSDGFPWGKGHPQMEKLTERVREAQIQRGYRSPRGDFLDEIKKWWGPLRKYEPLREAISRRDKIAKRWRPLKSPLSLPKHLAALRRAGFREVGVTWQELGSAGVLLAVR